MFVTWFSEGLEVASDRTLLQLCTTDSAVPVAFNILVGDVPVTCQIFSVVMTRDTKACISCSNLDGLPCQCLLLSFDENGEASL